MIRRKRAGLSWFGFLVLFTLLAFLKITCPEAKAASQSANLTLSVIIVAPEEPRESTSYISIQENESVLVNSCEGISNCVIVKTWTY